jgi:hypothetical protein
LVMSIYNINPNEKMVCLKRPFEKNQSTVDLLFVSIVLTAGVAICER